jgi:hypothetical protein
MEEHPDSLGANEEFKMAIEHLRKAHDKTSCAYCKAIAKDYARGLETYLEISDKSEKIWNIQNDVNGFLDGANNTANDMLQKTMPKQPSADINKDEPVTFLARLRPQVKSTAQDTIASVVKTQVKENITNVVEEIRGFVPRPFAFRRQR